ncbi:MAG: hypothetical protein ABF301_04335 [Sulfurovum sp.]|jgi:hypothetical protein
MLNNISSSFNNLDKKVIAEVFLLVFIFFIALNVFIINNKEENTKNISKVKTYKSKENIHTIYNKIQSIKNIDIVNSRLYKTQINISILSDLEHLEHLNFVINKIENINEHIKIDEINIKKDSNKFKMNIAIKTNYYAKKDKKFVIDYIAKEDVVKDDEVKVKSSDTKLTLNAIVFNSVILNNTYLKLNDYYNNYKLIDISNKSIKLSKNNEVFKVYLND